MSKELICALPLPPDAAMAPDWIMYVPGGRSEIAAHLDGRREVLTVTADRETAEVLQRDLSARRAAGGPQPYFDFDHQSGRRSGAPQEFAWRDGDKPGVYARVKWTTAGAQAVTAAAGQEPDYTHFSPRANFDDKTGRILGLMPGDRGNAAGGLVNDPAFERISAVALTAAKAAQAAEHQNETPMSKEVMATLAKAGLLSDEEAKAANAHELLASRVNALKTTPAKTGDETETTELKASLATMKTELAAMKATAADGFVRELTASGKIPPRAEGIKTMWRNAHLANPAQAETDAKELTASKALGEAMTDDNDTGGDGGDAPLNGPAVTARAQELLANKAASTPAAAWEQAAAELRAKK